MDGGFIGANSGNATSLGSENNACEGGSQETGGQPSSNINANYCEIGTFGKGGGAGYVGAGGGFYGGSKYGYATSGGSGYIGNPLLTNKHMVGYEVTESDEISTKTNSVTGTYVDTTPISDYAKKGNGYAIIKLIPEIE